MRLSSSFSLLAAALVAKASPLAEAGVRRHETTSSATATPTLTPVVVAPTAVPSTTLVKPDGGIGFNDTPTYSARSDYDYQTFYLGLHQSLLELNAFHNGLALFSEKEFAEAGLGPEEMYLLQYMAEQKEGHAQLLANLMGFEATFTGPQPSFTCSFRYPELKNIREFLELARLVTRFGESGALGALSHLDGQDAASVISDAVAIESRQQLVLRQFSGLFPMPFFFSTSITQSMQWTLLAPYIESCPAAAPPIEWTAFPSLKVNNNPFWPDLNLTADISSNVTAVTETGFKVEFQWGAVNESTGWNGTFATKSYATGAPAYVAWISQLNTTYTPLTVNEGSNNTGYTIQPFASVYGGPTTPLLNGTVYALITDAAVPVTPYNLSALENHILAGPALLNVG